MAFLPVASSSLPVNSSALIAGWRISNYSVTVYVVGGAHFYYASNRIISGTASPLSRDFGTARVVGDNT